MSNFISLPQGSLYETKELNLTFPSNWQIKLCDSPVDQMEPLSPASMNKAFANPIGTGPIRELAQGRQEIAIVFDDITRGTNVGQLVPYILEELSRAGVKDKQIRFICALGCHGAHTLSDFANKLGNNIIRRFPVYNHNPYENCQEVGKTSRGTPIALNPELMKCDFKIAVGSIVPHPLAEFGGGAKIITPGVSAIDTIYQYHSLAISILKKSRKEKNKAVFQELREEMGEISHLAGLDLIVNALVNCRCQTVDLVVGDPVEAYETGLLKARQGYATQQPPEADIVITNANFKANEAFLAVPFGSRSLKNGGDLVIIAHAPMGQVVHYLLGRFGNYTGGRMWNPRGAVRVSDKVGKIILFSPYQNYLDEDWFGGFGRVSWAGSWEEVMAIISAGRGPGTRVNVFTDATIQFLE